MSFRHGKDFSIRFAISIALFATAAVMTSPPTLLAASQTYSIAINCTSEGQLCTPLYSATITPDSWMQLTVEYTSSSPYACSNLRVHIFLDGVMKFLSDSLPPGGDTGPINLDIVGAGTHTVGVQGEGELGGCNPGNLSSWSGTLSVSETTPVPVIRILPQLVFGGGWYTALYFTNTNAVPFSFTATFAGNDGNPLTIPSLGGSSVTVNLAARGTAHIEVPDLGSLVQGYVTATLPIGVTGYGVLRQSIPGAPDQEASVPFSGTTATTSTVLFDETNYITGIAMANLASVNNIITATARDNQGNTIGTGTFLLTPNAKTALALRNFPGLASIAGLTGSVDFTANTGNIATLGLRFDGTAFTYIPTFDPTSDK
ncbi:MAG TPA: hypothetical protein VGL72_25885 [Bryobacteraceae bacterium]|jgi:hypothetical protein